MGDGWPDALTRWRRELRAAGRRPGTVRLRLAHLRAFADRHPPGPAAVTRDQLVDYLAVDRSPEYRRSVRSSLTTFFAWAEQAGLVGADPARRLPTVTVPRAAARPVDDEAILAALAQASPRVLLMVRLMAELGLRRAETAAVHTRDVELAGLRVVGKGGHERVVALPRDLRTVLSALPAGPVFPGRDHGHLSAGYVGRLVSTLLPATVTPHQLRHAAAAAWDDLGLPINDIRDQLGHASVATTQRYLPVRADRARAVVEAAAARLHPGRRRQSGAAGS